MTDIFAPPAPEDPYAWEKLFALYGAITGMPSYGRLWSLTSFTDDDEYHMTLDNEGTGRKALNVPNVLQAEESGVTANELTVTGSATIGGTLGVDGATTLGSTLDVAGATTLASTLDVTGATALGSTLAVTGAATFADTLEVTGATTLNDTLDGAGAATLADTLDVAGAVTLDDTLDVAGAAVFAGTVRFDGNVGFGVAPVALPGTWTTAPGFVTDDDLTARTATAAAGAISASGTDPDAAKLSDTQDLRTVVNQIQSDQTQLWNGFNTLITQLKTTGLIK